MVTAVRTETWSIFMELSIAASSVLFEMAEKVVVMTVIYKSNNSIVNVTCS